MTCTLETHLDLKAMKNSMCVGTSITQLQMYILILYLPLAIGYSNVVKLWYV